MAARHLDALFSEAYDGALSNADRRRFDDHLASCSRCAGEFAAFGGAVDALRGLPQARMPVPVRLPSSAPAVARRRHWWSGAWRVPRFGPATALGGALAIGAAAAFVAVSLHNRQGGQPNAAGSAANALNVPAQCCDQSQRGPLAFGAAPAGCAPQTLPDAAAAPPDGYANRVSQAVPGRPGEVLVLATPTRTYAAGATVIVYARLIPASTSSGSAVLPCVQLAPSAKAAEGLAAPSGAAAPVPNNDANAAAVATPTAGPDGTTLLTITLPRSLAAGETVQLVAYLPAGYPDAGDTAPISATLTLTIAPASSASATP